MLLLKRGNETLVKPAGPRVVAKASRWRVGQSVTVDARGRFIDNTKGIEAIFPLLGTVMLMRAIRLSRR